MFKADRIPGQKPRAVHCYICGQGYGTSSIMIHVKACQKKWEIAQEQLPRERRRKCPQPPPEFLMLTGQAKLTGSQIDDLNTIGFNQYNDEALEKCPYCNRSFNAQAYMRHMKLCTEDKPLNPLPSKNNPGPKGGRQASYEEPEEEEEEVYQPPPKKQNGKVLSSTQGIGSSKTPPINKTGAKVQAEPPRKSSAMAKKTQEDLMDEYLYNGNPPPKQPAKGGLVAPITKPASGVAKKPGMVQAQAPPPAPAPAKVARPAPGKSTGGSFDEIKPKGGGANANFDRMLAMAEKTLAALDLVPCQKCGRTFVSDRIAKHQKACKVNSKPKKVKVFHKKITDKEKQKIKKGKGGKWKQQHEEFMAQMQYMRKLKAVEEQGGNIRDLPPPPPSANSNLLECPYCARRFNPEAHAKHINICKNVINKPKPVPGKAPVMPKNVSPVPMKSTMGSAPKPMAAAPLSKTNPLGKSPVGRYK